MDWIIRASVVVVASSSMLLSGCALTPEQVAARAKLKSNSELCMATIQFPQYGDAIARELASRNHSCDWALTTAQVRAAETTAANQRAALQSLAAINTQPTYQIVQPAPLLAPAPFQPPSIQPAGVTAYWTGKQHQVQTVTYQSGWNCEYNYAGRTFWRTFVGSCPSSVQVQ
jgi:hypothetical protein